jgi:Ca2+-binding EF-hand superfamily protein
MRHPKVFNQCGVRYLALLIKDNAVPIDECFCQFASVEAITEGLETIKISEESFLEVAAYLLGEFLDADVRLNLFQVMDIDHDGFLNIHDWRESLASAEYWMSEEGKHFSAAVKIQSIWRGHYERGALAIPASGLFTIEAIFEPIENQKYWDDEEEEIFFDNIPAIVIDDTLSARDVLSALTALAHSKGFTPHSLFVFICKSSAFEPNKSFSLDEFVESFMNLCGEKLTDELHEALSQAFKQLLDLNGDSKVSSTEFFWVMRQYFEAQHASTWIENEATESLKNVVDQPFAMLETQSEANNNNPGLLSNNYTASIIPDQLNDNRRDISQLESLEGLIRSPVGDSNISPIALHPVSIENVMSTTSTIDAAHHSLAPNTAFQLADAIARAAELKKSSEAEASSQLAEAAAIKLAAEKLFAEATELKRATEAAASKQIAEAASIRQAAEIASAKRSAEIASAAQSVDMFEPKKSAVQFASDQPSKENLISAKSFKSRLSLEMNSPEGPSSKVSDASVSLSASVGPVPKSTSTSKPVAFDPRTLAHGYDPATADLKTIDLNSYLGMKETQRPSSSGDPHMPKSVRFASNRPSTSDGSRSLSFDVNISPQSHVSQSHQSRQPNSQQYVIKKSEEEANSAPRRSHERPSSSHSSSLDLPNKPTLPNKAAGSDITKRVLYVDSENACTWIRACAPKIGSRCICIVSHFVLIAFSLLMHLQFSS